ncbi:endoplasmic reticulum-Golgi intermediate compartment protein [Salix suchowensis]|nr:endoplasmic reticulum-Golgi intermediate compartment protein [Salix suchowensis]
MDGLMSKLRKLDAYPKVNEDFYSRTLSGGVITLASSIVMFLLFFSELRIYPTCSPKYLDSFSCLAQNEKALQRHGGRLEHNETCCGSCYGAETSAEDCCNSCEEVLGAYRKKGWAMTNPEFNVLNPGFAVCFTCNIQCKREGFLRRFEDEEGEGCSIYGFLEVNKVAGNLHFSGKSFQQSGVMYMICWHFRRIINHKINRLFSVTEHFRGADIGRHQSLPGVFFFYDLSPIKVTFTEERVSFLHFLTNVISTISRVIRQLVYFIRHAIIWGWNSTNGCKQLNPCREIVEVTSSTVTPFPSASLPLIERALVF